MPCFHTSCVLSVNSLMQECNHLINNHSKLIVICHWYFLTDCCIAAGHINILNSFVYCNTLKVVSTGSIHLQNFCCSVWRYKHVTNVRDLRVIGQIPILSKWSFELDSFYSNNERGSTFSKTFIVLSERGAKLSLKTSDLLCYSYMQVSQIGRGHYKR